MPKTIKIFLVDGEPNGLRTAELSNWVGKSIVIPRNKIKDAKDRPDCKKPAVYFLVGKENEADILPTAYIGEAENLWNRLSSHDNNKDFWQTAIAFISKDDNLTKAHVRYLESKCVEIATQAKRFLLENSATPSSSTLPEADIAEMEEFLLNLKLLLAAVGYPILQTVVAKEQESADDPLFYCKGKGASATGRMTNDGFVVYKGSTATANLSKVGIKVNQKILETLKSNGYLEKKDDLYIFVKEYVFNSPSGASNIISGNPSNGWTYWKTKNGKNLKDIYEN